MSKTSLTQTSHKAAVQTYRFESGSDSSIHSVSFKGSIRKPETSGILESTRRTSYEKCGGTILDHLDSHKLDYLKFTVRGKLVRDRIPFSLRTGCSTLLPAAS